MLDTATPGDKTLIATARDNAGNVATAEVHYTVLEVDGPPHDRRFSCAAHVAGEQLGVGSGLTKKAAEQQAAREALEALGVVPERI